MEDMHLSHLSLYTYSAHIRAVRKIITSKNWSVIVRIRRFDEFIVSIKRKSQIWKFNLIERLFIFYAKIIEVTV